MTPSSVSFARRHRRPGFHLAALTLACAQLLVLGAAPFADSTPSAPSHVEATGTGHHYAHDEATCAACAARQLVGLPMLLRLPSLAQRITASPNAPRRADPDVPRLRSPSSPRSPPRSA
ncbi:MAG TPA: hypothetical protein VEI06_12600 [Gemmatimonadaceae bacterium]|nr:hypothetical protein [Gemmatimonadaceae bacterium]